MSAQVATTGLERRLGRYGQAAARRPRNAVATESAGEQAGIPPKGMLRHGREVARTETGLVETSGLSSALTIAFVLVLLVVDLVLAADLPTPRRLPRSPLRGPVFYIAVAVAFRLPVSGNGATPTRPVLGVPR